MSNYWAERRQDRRIGELDEQLSAARRSAAVQANRLHSELSEVKGTLEQRLNRLTRSFDAFVELSDLRAELVGFDGPARVRFQAGALIDGTLDPADGLGTADVPGYWLAPAAEGVAAALRGSTAAAKTHIEAAHARDPERTAVFTLLALRTLAGPETTAAYAVELLNSALPDIPAEVRRHQRELWTSAADGAFGEVARDLVRRHMLNVVDRDSGPRSVEDWEAVGGRSTVQALRGLQGTAEAVNRVTRADRLGALRSLLQDRLGGPPSTPASGAPESPEDTESPERTESTADAENTASTGTPATRVLQLLVNEGSDREAPILARVAELRDIIEGNGSPSAAPEQLRWDAPVGSAIDLLRADATGSGDSGGSGDSDGSEVPEQRRRAALLAFAPHIRAAAEQLAAEASAPLEDKAVVSYAGRRIEVSSAGPDEAALAAAHDAMTAVDPDPARAKTWYLALGGGALLAAVVAVATGSPLAWVAAAAFVVGGIAYNVKVSRDTSDTGSGVDAFLRRQAEKGAESWRALYRRATDAQAGVDDDLRAVYRLLEGGQ